MLGTKGWLASYDEATVSFGVLLYLYVTMYICFVVCFCTRPVIFTQNVLLLLFHDAKAVQ